jgi:hypothetical protein
MKKSAIEIKVQINLPSIEISKVRYDLALAQIEKFRQKKPEEYELYDFSYMPLTYRNTKSLVVIVRKSDNQAYVVRWEKFLTGAQFGPSYKNDDLCYVYAANLITKTQMELFKLGVGKDVYKRFDKLGKFYTKIKEKKWGPFSREMCRKIEKEWSKDTKIKNQKIKNLPVCLGMNGDKECYMGSFEEHVDRLDTIVRRYAPTTEAIGFDALALAVGINLGQ